MSFLNNAFRTVINKTLIAIRVGILVLLHILSEKNNNYGDYEVQIGNVCVKLRKLYVCMYVCIV